MKGNYVSIHSSGFRDFLLKPEVLRAIVDCGFEHPSEIQHECIPQVSYSEVVDRSEMDDETRRGMETGQTCCPAVSPRFGPLVRVRAGRRGGGRITAELTREFGAKLRCIIL